MCEACDRQELVASIRSEFATLALVVECSHGTGKQRQRLLAQLAKLQAAGEAALVGNCPLAYLRETLSELRTVSGSCLGVR